MVFENYERRIERINKVLNENGIRDLDEAKTLCDGIGVDVAKIVKEIQPICFDNACYAYMVGAAIAIKRGVKKADEVAKCIGEGLQAFCIPGSVADERKVGLGHGNLGSMLLSDSTECFAFVAGHESFAAAEGAIGIANNANKVRSKTPILISKVNVTFSFRIKFVYRDILIAFAIIVISSVISTISAASIATSLPTPPIAIPRSARARTGASLIPSPTYATTESLSNSFSS